MSDLGAQAEAEAEARAKKADKGQNALKLVAGLVFLMVSVGFLIHRIPRHRYVEAHADKPRPKVVAKGEEPAAVKPQAPKPAPTPAGRAVKKEAGAAVAAAASAGGASPAEDAEPVEDWRDACEAEIGILCNNVAESGQPRCLRRYDDAVRKDCLKALLLLSGAGPE